MGLCLPSLWPRVEFQGRQHTWIQFVVGSHPCSKRFFSGYSGFPLCSKTIISKSLIRSGSGMVNEFEPLCECAIPTSLYTHYKLICKPHGLLSTFLNPIQTGLFLRFLWPWLGSLEVPLSLSKKSFVWLNVAHEGFSYLICASFSEPETSRYA